MKINKKYNSIIEWVIAIVLVVICLKQVVFSYGNFSPIKAHEQSERTYNYGPSEIVKTIDLDKRKIYLCKYKDWFSANTLERRLIRWYPGSGVGGYPIDYSKQVSYSWDGSAVDKKGMFYKVYGYVVDNEITTILFEDKDKLTTKSYDLDESRMFIFYWYENSENKNTKNYLRGLDSTGKIVYEEEIGGF